MESSNQFLEITTGHVTALMQYIADVKPYHTKLRQVVEEYIFADEINVNIDTTHSMVTFLGADILDPKVYARSSRKSASSWRKQYTSDGIRSRFLLPLISHPKFLSHSNQDSFICGIHDDTQIPGLINGAFSQKRWDGPGITKITLNGRQLHESIDFDISHGAFSIQLRGNTRWKQLDINHRTEFPILNGELRYNDVHSYFGSITNIITDIYQPIYDEWTLRCIAVTNNSATLSVTGKFSGYIGDAELNVPFNSAQISFLFTTAINTPPFSPLNISIDDTFILTPANKITVHPDAPDEIWTFIKVNPRKLINVLFVPGVAILPHEFAPDIQIYTRDLYKTPQSRWEIRFINDNQFRITGYDNTLQILNGYPKIVDIINGCSFKDELIHFTFIPSIRGFKLNDVFTFNIQEDSPTFRVFGSISGWQVDATVGEWYWNNKIGFKIPKLDYFSVGFTPNISISEDGQIWNTVLANGQDLTHIEYIVGNNRSGFLVTGNSSIIASSINARNWVDDVSAVIATGQRGVVIGQNGFIATTTISTQQNSFQWYQRNSRTTENLNSIIFAQDFLQQPNNLPTVYGLYVVVGNNGVIITSANGDAWMLQSSNVNVNLNSITYKFDAAALIFTFVCVGNNGTILTSEDGILWTSQISSTSSNLNYVSYIDELNLFIAVGDNGIVLTSADGIIWVDRSVQTTNNLFEFAYMPISQPQFPYGKIVVIGSNGFLCWSKNATLSWQTTFTSRFNSIVWANGMFVAVGTSLPIPVEQIEYLAEPHPILSPRIYQITIVDEDNDYKFAKVVCNITGYKRGLKISKLLNESDVWTDGFIKFKIIDNPIKFNRGDIVNIYITPSKIFDTLKWYDEAPYELLPYDTSKIKLPLAYFYEYFPLYHSQGTVLIYDSIPGDQIRIDKAYFDTFRIKIDNIISNPRLAVDNNSWAPFEFRYGDRIVNNTVVSSAEFSDLATIIDAYLATDPEFKAFSLIQPRYKCSKQSSYCLLQFTEEFIQQYLPLGTIVTLQAMPREAYGQLINVKITENFRVFAKINLLFDDIVYINLYDNLSPITEIISSLQYDEFINIQISEDGIIPYFIGYDILPYDSIPYNLSFAFGNIYGMVEFPPGSNNFIFTGNPTDFVNLNTSVEHTAGILVSRKNDDVSGAHFTEGLIIIDSSSTHSRIHVIYNTDLYLQPITPPVPIDGLLINQDADEYIVTHNYSSGTPFLIVESVNNPGIYLNPVPNNSPFNSVPTATSSTSFSFSVPSGTAPFRLRLV